MKPTSLSVKRAEQTLSRPVRSPLRCALDGQLPPQWTSTTTGRWSERQTSCYSSYNVIATTHLGYCTVASSKTTSLISSIACCGVAAGRRGASGQSTAAGLTHPLRKVIFMLQATDESDNRRTSKQ